MTELSIKFSGDLGRVEVDAEVQTPFSLSLDNPRVQELMQDAWAMYLAKAKNEDASKIDAPKIVIKTKTVVQS